MSGIPKMEKEIIRWTAGSARDNLYVFCFEGKIGASNTKRRWTKGAGPQWEDKEGETVISLDEKVIRGCILDLTSTCKKVLGVGQHWGGLEAFLDCCEGRGWGRTSLRVAGQTPGCLRLWGCLHASCYLSAALPYWISLAITWILCNYLNIFIVLFSDFMKINGKMSLDIDNHRP